MSIHPSLASSAKHKKARSVLKRLERIRTMIDKNQWKQGDDVCGLPKIKTIRIKIKKEKAEKTEATAATAEGAPGAPAPEAKEQAPAKGAAAKGAAGKSQDKK